MTIYTDGAVIRRGQTLEEFQTPLGDYLGAKFDQALDNPLNLATDNRALSQAQDNVVGDYADPLTGFALGELKVTPKPRITADEVRARSEEAGVKVDVPEGGLTSEALDILIARRKRQQVQNDAINRSETGARSFAGFGVQLGASLLDPLNIGLAFVPVVGQARYAGMIAKAGGAAGRAGVRVGVGAAEGAAGVAAFEPFAFAMHKSLQDDYSALDSLINIGFGSALGGGLHVVGGAAKDAFLGQWWKPNIPPAPLPELPGTIYGGGTRIKIGENYETARWAVVDAGEVEATMTKAENQFRDRTRVASDEQIRDIANKIDFELLGDSPVMDFGAPTLTADGRIVGGNGRMAAIGRAYDIGTGMRYSDALKRELAKYGIDPAALENMKKPALVRVLDNEVDVKRAAILSNEGGALRMSALEQSKVDAERLGDFRAFDVNDNGEINTAGNRAFIRSWVNQQPVNQRSALMDADGMLSVEGQARLRNAILFKAYGDSPTLGRLVEATDPGSRNVASALTRSAGRVADAQESIKTGDLYDVDIAPDVRAAVEKLDQLRKANSSVAEFLAQGDMLGSGLTPDAIKVMQFMEQNIRSPRAISDMLNRYYDGLVDAGNPKQGDIFGGGAPSKTALLDRAIDAENADPSAASVVEKATPQQREAAMRTAVGQAVDGRVVDVEPIFSREADVVSSLQRQSSPEAVRVADVPAARAADERLATAPKSEALADAEAELARVMKDLEERAGVVADDVVDAGTTLYHGGTFKAGADVSGVLYLTKNKDLAASYVTMSVDRTGSGSLSQVNVNLEKQAPANVVNSIAQKIGIETENYTPASVFDSELHGADDVASLVKQLQKLGYDHAVLGDVSYGTGISDDAVIVFDGKKTSAQPEAPSKNNPVAREPVIRADASSNARQVDLPAFKQWFGESKVRDEAGQPIVVYHGSNVTIDRFDPSFIGKNFGKKQQDEGFWFSAEKDQALEYASNIDGTRTGKVTNPVYLSLKNPAIWGDTPDNKPLKGGFVKAAKEAGHDGVIFRNIEDGTGIVSDQYLVFDAKNIKSAIGNSGAFDPNSGSLTDQIQSSMKRQSSPESVRVADPKASEAATERLSTATKSESLADAEAELARVMKDLEERAGVKLTEETAPAIGDAVPAVTRNYKSYEDFLKSAIPFPKGYNDVPRVEVTVPINKLVATQDRIDPDGLVYYGRGEGFFQGDAPEVVLNKSTGDYIVLDGHHRTSTAIESGAKYIAVDVVGEVPAPAAPKNPLLRELQVYDDAIKSSEELGRAARAAAICDLRA